MQRVLYNSCKIRYIRGCLDHLASFFTLSYRMFEHMHKVLNIEKTLITQIVCKLYDKSFKPNCCMI
jgi:hypothetical protein